MARGDGRAGAPSRLVTPETFVAAGRRPGDAEVVVVAGDSVAYGKVSGDFIAMVRDDLPPGKYEFVNAGVGGELSYNLLARLDAVIACRPDVVVILIGTNDAAAHINSAWRDRYVKRQNLPRTPSLEWFRENVSEIVRRLQQETSARIALIEIPPIGEDLGSAYNRHVKEHNAALRAIGETAGVEVLPLYERLVAAIPPGHKPPRFTGQSHPMLTAALAHRFLRRSFDRISDRRGFAVLTDNIHLNERAARQVATLVEEFLRR
ncbi:GDSL-type esterase/lipase family protein [Mycobacterium sp. MYCO198283]|uniref:SGNH/GDSL hydrolase family protein n=1 Tax=Mycobacterium sp. MYCO198283 TaxID=2883505 RepID=UPI001E5AA9C8|nr:GDSL-type esterase/lipase family protein [Mycobacterium sp. MYCO198283]MCG5430914.1 GDSL-type esterase/lipase family protein [Mycobacterium sp. MYCO198283]